MTGPAATATWQPRGLLLPTPGGPPDWTTTHVALPWVDEDCAGALTLYYSGRDEQGRARISRAPLTVTGEALGVDVDAATPVLDLGELGAFDDSGVTMSCLVRRPDGELLLYYTGWSLAVTVPFQLAIGLATSRDDGVTWQRASRAPVLDRSHADPLMTASPCVVFDEDAGRWRAWYVSCEGWDHNGEDGATRHRYHVRHAWSDDAVSWQADGHVAVDFAFPDEYAMGRPFVRRLPGGAGWEMLFCVRGDDYVLARATSADGLTWTRDPHHGLPQPDGSGWASSSTSYPVAFTHGGVEFLLYDGDGYGATGLGYAVRRD